MKTLEQKAKAYDEALEKARIWKDKSGMPKDKQGILDDIFPELAESEDEKIRKTLINGFNKLDKSAVWYNGITNAQILDWLEKQVNHANFRNKIQIGDKVTRNRDGVLVNLSQLNRVAKVEEKQGEQKPTDEEIKELLRTEYEKGRADAIAEMQKSWSDDFEEEMDRYIEENFYGSADNGFFSNRTKRELEVEDVVRIGCYFAAWQKEQSNKELSDKSKQEWSEEDEEHIKSLLERLEGMCKKDATFIRTKFAVSEDEDWLKSFKDRMQPQNLTVTDKELAQAKKDAYNDALDKIEYHSGEPTFDDGWSAAIWYLKKKNAQPQSQWKPSDEQIIALRWVLNNIPYNKHKEEISGLLDQIKDL